LDWCLHPLEGIALAGLLFALYYWVIRLRCRARMAQAFIFVAVLAVTLCTFATLSVMIETDQPAYLNHATTQVTQPQPLVFDEVAAAPMQRDISPSPDVSSKNVSLLQRHDLMLGLYALGVVAVLIGFIVQMSWYWRMRKKSTLETEDGGVEVFTAPCVTPFSFVNSVFLPYGLDEEVRRYALIHEKYHIRHHHFFKLCLMLLLVALNWFNPFVWMFFSEIKMQQELEVDMDVLAEGIDRRHYQMSLLQVCVQNSRWLMVQSAFGSKSLKQRIIFMNKRIKRFPSRVRLAACMLGLAIFLTIAMAVRAQISFTMPHHPLEGCWTMDFTRPASTNMEQYPPFKQYAFYNHDTFFSPHLSSRDGMNFFFGFSGEEVVMRGDSLVNAHGEALVYRFVSDDTFQCDWKKSSTDNSLAQGEVITDQWSRATPAAEILKAFHLACDADQNKQRPFDGVWQLEPSDNGGKANEFLLVNGDLMMAIEYVPDPNSSIYRYSGAGISTVITASNDTIKSEMMKATIVMDGKDHAVMEIDGRDETSRLNRIPMPPHIQRMLATTKI
ncbi:MAG: M56 family metallopeptidase, partial [Prevotella sp.]|nr:M56 family metallopeptidase [Prevotella sp.]